MRALSRGIVAETLGSVVPLNWNGGGEDVRVLGNSADDLSSVGGTTLCIMHVKEGKGML